MTKPFSEYGVQGTAFDASLPASLGLRADDRKIVAPLRLSISQLTTLRWSLLDEISQFKQTGYDAIGVWRPKLVEYGEERAAEMLQRARLPVSSLSFAGGFTGGCGFSYLEAIADGRQAIQQAQILGASHVIMVGGSRNGHTVRHSRRMVVDGMRELADLAGAAQVKLSLMPMHRYFSKNWTFLNSLDEGLEMIAEIDHSQVCLAFDTYHLWQEPRLLERIPEIAPMTGIVQLSDGDRLPNSDRDRLLPGDGLIPLPNIIQAFQTAGYSGYFDVQVWSSNVWKSNYAHQIEQSHAAVKAMSLRTALNP